MTVLRGILNQLLFPKGNGGKIKHKYNMQQTQQHKKTKAQKNSNKWEKEKTGN